jgi:hypothetical protein
LKHLHIVKQPSSAESKAAAFIAGGKLAPAETGKVTVTMRFDAALLAKMDGAARKQGISEARNQPNCMASRRGGQGARGRLISPRA